MRRLIVIGTRGSKLALWQANKVKSELEALKFSCTLKIIKTQGDQIQNIGFDKMEGKGFFTKEIEDALLDGSIDAAVHSLKDLPTEQPKGLVLAGLSERAEPSDRLLIRKEIAQEGAVWKLHSGATVGTSSIRRKKLLLDLRPDIEIKELRGNVPTRVQKLRDSQYDAIILASAGLMRLDMDLSDLEVVRLHPREFVPAPGQGVIAYQVREEDLEMRKIIGHIHHHDSSDLTNIERKVLKLMDGGCQVPLGAYCEKDSAGNYHLFAAYQPDNADHMIRHRISQSTTSQLAERIVEQLTS